MDWKKFLFLSLLLMLAVMSGCNKSPADAPSWLKDLIQQKMDNSVENPPTQIYECAYKGNTVYLVSSACCDQYDHLYNETGEVICAPSGGFTGKGDGRCKDFSLDTNECRIFWKDSRVR